MKKQLPCIIVLAFLISCQSEIETSDAEMSHLDSVHLAAHSRAGDTIQAYVHRIPYWHAGSQEGDYNPNWYLEEKGRTTFRFPGIKFRIDGLFSQNEEYMDEDTLYLLEDVGWYLEGRQMWIDAANDSDQFELHLAVHQRVTEVFTGDYSDPDFDWEKWERKYYHTEQRSQFYQLEDSAGRYRLPWAHTVGGFFYERFIEENNYDSTYYHRPGEMGGTTATFKVNGKPCMWMADYGIMRISRISSSGLKSYYYFKIFYSYGC